MRIAFVLLTLMLLPLLISAQTTKTKKAGMENTSPQNCSEMTDEEWKQKLTPEQYRVLREQGTERAFTGKYYKHHDDGVYTCSACGHKLFDSKTKYESGSGWPSYYQPFDKSAVKTRLDKSHGMIRTEVVCGNCGGHLGHVFDDGPKPTGQRFCINSISLDFKPRIEVKPLDTQ